MDKIIEWFKWLETYGDQGIYIVFAVLLACGFGMPLPEDIPLVVAGLLAGQGYASLGLTLFLCMAGVLMGDSIIFLIGSRYGNKAKKFFLFKHVFTEKREVKILAWFNKHGNKSVFFARFLPGLRMPVFFTSGLYKVPFWKFFLIDGFAALISVPIWVLLAYYFSKNLDVLEEKLNTAKYGLFIGIAVLVVLYFVFRFFKKKFKKASGEDEISEETELRRRP